MNNLKTINNLVKKLIPYQPEKVFIFGSSVNNSFTSESDIDIAVIKKTNQPFYQRARDIRKLLRSKIPLDVFVFTPEEFARSKATNPVVAQIHQTGKIVYDQTN